MTGLVRRPHGQLPDGRDVDLVELSGERLSLSLSAFGARIVRLLAPDRDGRPGDVVLGYDDLAGYVADRDFHGATVGRYANRIGGGRFELDGEVVEVSRNEPATTLHGGPEGFARQLWDLSETEPADGGEVAVLARRTSPDGEMGFPGRLDVELVVTLAGTDVVLDYVATTDAPTVVGLTQHAYLNLAGGGSVDDHLLQVDAAAYLPVGADLLPLEGPEPVQDSAFDLRTPRRVGDVVRQAHPQLLAARGLDHCFVPDGAAGAVRRAARAEHPASGRSVEVWTDQPGLQVYAGGWLDGTAVGRGGRTLRQGDGLCLEPQLLPDTPNRPDFGSAVLRPGETYRQREVLRLGVVA